MAAISSVAVTVSIPSNPSLKSAPFSSSSSLFFNNNVRNRTGIALSAARPAGAKKRGMSCNCIFGLGVPELVVIAGVAVLVFGPKKLPEVGRSIGKTIKGFQEAAKEFESELKKDEEPAAEQSGEKSTASNEEEKKDATVPSTKESS